MEPLWRPDRQNLGPLWAIRQARLRQRVVSRFDHRAKIYRLSRDAMARRSRRKPDREGPATDWNCYAENLARCRTWKSGWNLHGKPTVQRGRPLGSLLRRFSCFKFPLHSKSGMLLAILSIPSLSELSSGCYTLPRGCRLNRRVSTPRSPYPSNGSFRCPPNTSRRRVPPLSA